MGGLRTEQKSFLLGVVTVVIGGFAGDPTLLLFIFFGFVFENH